MLKAQAHGLDPIKAAEAAAIATAYIVNQCAEGVGIDIGHNVAAAGFIEGCKTVPPALKPPTNE